ncbi:hypothetical protein JTB14_006605 [Gonioctena quinquepunctata]|nr:hypothetical protein JTB14_006605 [Gonioctena quinquepunctata]
MFYQTPVKAVVGVASIGILDSMNSMLISQRFPAQSKRAVVDLIPKIKIMKKENASYYGLICLLDTLGKLYEVLRERQVKALEDNSRLWENQYGFRERRSTIQAIQMGGRTGKSIS